MDATTEMREGGGHPSKYSNLLTDCKGRHPLSHKSFMDPLYCCAALPNVTYLSEMKKKMMIIVNVSVIIYCLLCGSDRRPAGEGRNLSDIN